MTQAHPRVRETTRPRPSPGFPAIDYERHPAYAPFPAASAETNSAARELLSGLDATLRIAGGGSLGSGRRRLDALFRAEVDEQLRELLEITLRSVGRVGLERDALRHAAAALRPALFDEALYESQRHRDPGVRQGGAISEHIGSRMREAGVFACLADPGRVQSLLRLAAPLRREVEHRAAEARGQRCQVNVPQEGPLWQAIGALIRDTGLQGGLSNYDRHDLKVAWATLERSNAEQTWWGAPYRGEGLTTSRCAYFHNDHSHRTLKTILYLSDVGDQNGPFGYVAGSHRWQRSSTATAFVKALDQGRLAAWEAQNPGADNDYRPYLVERKAREGFMLLPAPLRATSHFGDDVLDGSALSARLLAAEQVFGSAEANCIAFDGDRGIHRGGLVREGTRWALQLGFTESRSAPTRVKKRAKQWVRRTFGRMR